jgi:hypothetical protein
MKSFNGLQKHFCSLHQKPLALCPFLVKIGSGFADSIESYFSYIRCLAIAELQSVPKTF